MSSEGLPILPPVLTRKGFALKKKIAEGGFASVYIASWTGSPNIDIAAKVISLGNVDQVWVLKNLKNEMKIIKRLKHPNVIHVHEILKTASYAYIFMEWAEKGSVSDILERSDKPFSEPIAKKYSKDILNGLAYIHGQGVAHRDIKPDNFLVDKNDKVMLSDFGFACISLANSGVRLMKGTSCGTSDYMAIEIKLKKEGEVYDAKATDLYSFGISLYLMVYYDLPFDPRNKLECIQKQVNKQYRHRSSMNTSEPLRDLIDKLLNPNPKTRITSEDALKHRWLE